MSRRRLLAGASGGGSTPPPDPPPELVDPLDANPGTPYALNGNGNAPVYAITPTPDGSGSAVHPDVIDFGPGNEWNGWRFWMALTPYLNSAVEKEQPCVLVSADGFTWQTPTGDDPENLFVNTVPGSIQGDTDLVYDPDEDRLILMWVEFCHGPGFVLIAESTDGVTWSERHVIIEEPAEGTSAGTFPFSPAMVRVGPGDWRLWARRESEAYPFGFMLRYTATDPFAPWTYAGIATPGFPNGGRFWHMDIIHHGDRFLGLFSFASNYAATSVDGITWTTTQLVSANRPTEWDSFNMYRGTLQPHVNGEDMRVWYSSEGPDSWRIGYVMVPMSLWDT